MKVVPLDYQVVIRQRERYVRAKFYLVSNMLPDDGDDAVLDAFRILDSVSIPKGAVRPSEDEFHYTAVPNCIQLNIAYIVCEIL